MEKWQTGLNIEEPERSAGYSRSKKQILELLGPK